VIFFFASAAAGAAYLTASENFPVEIRALSTNRLHPTLAVLRSPVRAVSSQAVVGAPC
jgi:hypothetical protein